MSSVAARQKCSLSKTKKLFKHQFLNLSYGHFEKKTRFTPAQLVAPFTTPASLKSPLQIDIPLTYKITNDRRAVDFVSS